MRYSGEKSFGEFFDFLSKNDFSYNCEKLSDTDFNDFVKSFVPIKLPEAYLQFMRYAGYGRFFVGSDYSIGEVKQLSGYARELLEENNFPHRLSENDFVFFMHQGYMFYFFKLDEGNDPPVYFYDECRNQTDFVKCYDSFTDFIIDPYITGIPRPL